VEAERARLIESLRTRVADERVLAAIAAVRRELFVAPGDRERAYANVPLPIGCNQTVSQPLVVARMCEMLELSSEARVLDVGTGSGYHAAVLAQLAKHVYSIERHAELSERAQESLDAAGITNVSLFLGDGARGLPEHAPFDAINVGAAALRAVPEELEAELAPGGRLIAPVQGRLGQRLVLVRITPEGPRRSQLDPVRFVRLVV
jgi:protein-L-isoaspartate(D-aspartate) O-methyltransferase